MSGFAKERFWFIIGVTLVFNAALTGQIVLTSQSQVDSFPINYPNVTEIDYLRIYGSDVQNLDSLKQLEVIHNWMSIGGTKIQGLSPFENLTLVPFNSDENFDLLIIDNDSLLQLSDLYLMNLPPHLDMVVGSDAFNYCEEPFLCEKIQEHWNIRLSSNQEACMHILEMMDNCNGPIDQDLGNTVFSDSFEEWDEFDVLNWDIGPPKFQMFGDPFNFSYYKEAALTEGNHSIVIQDDTLKYDFEEPISQCHLYFDMRIMHYGNTVVKVDEYNAELDTVFSRIILDHFIDTTTDIFNVQFEHVTPTYPGYQIASIYIISRPTIFPIPNGVLLESPRINIDNFRITSDSITTSTNQILDPEITFYPNPVEDVLFIACESVRSAQVQILDMHGRLRVKGETHSKIDVASLEAGFYFIRIDQGEIQTTRKFVKL